VTETGETDADRVQKAPPLYRLCSRPNRPVRSTSSLAGNAGHFLESTARTAIGGLELAWTTLSGPHNHGVYANKDFVESFASKFRPLLMTQEVKLLQAAPWGPHP
jgi:hypothetical protein